MHRLSLCLVTSPADLPCLCWSLTAEAERVSVGLQRRKRQRRYWHVEAVNRQDPPTRATMVHNKKTKRDRNDDGMTLRIDVERSVEAARLVLIDTIYRCKLCSRAWHRGLNTGILDQG